MDEFTVIVPMGVDVGWPIDMVILLPGVGMLVATANIEVTLTVNASGKLMVSVPLGPVE